MKTYTDIEQKRIIAENLQELITRSGKDQRNIASDLDINPPTFNQWVTGKATPQVSTLRKVANYFKVPFTYLINDHDDLISEEGKSTEVLPPDLANMYLELSPDGKETVHETIRSEHGKYNKQLTDYKRAISLDKITTLEDARAILGNSAAFGGFATDEQLIAMANIVLKDSKKKKK